MTSKFLSHFQCSQDPKSQNKMEVMIEDGHNKPNVDLYGLYEL